MNSYQKTFDNLKKKKEKALIPFVVIGDPSYQASLDIVRAIIRSGADILELGFPFSDPIADGPTIQAADVRALKEGINTDRCFEFVKDIRKFSAIPIGLLVYYNLIYQRGTRKFFHDCKLAGVSSVLAADVPPEESDELMHAAKTNEISPVFMVSPLTGEKRLRKILDRCTGFVYIVSRLGATGAREDIEKSTLSLIAKVRKKTALPLCVGFGISRPSHVKAVCKAGADGAIVGSALVRIIEDNLKDKKHAIRKIETYISSMKQATKD
ncbi:tryptophan synthase subunit alpha [Candidatus Woesearchaeota archaeon]|nr:tryptophan synthase subunit alpha [Candidatus Woesearchaeota archaeon]